MRNCSRHKDTTRRLTNKLSRRLAHGWMIEEICPAQLVYLRSAGVGFGAMRSLSLPERLVASER